MRYFDGIHEACIEKWAKLDERLPAEDIGCIIAGDLPSVRYITGYLPYLTLSPSHGQIGLYIPGRRRPILYPIYYYVQYAVDRFPWLDVRRPPDSLTEFLAALSELQPQMRAAGSRVGVVGLPGTWEVALREQCELDVFDATELVSELRARKTPAELSLLRESVRVAEVGMRQALASLSSGRTGCDVAADAEAAMRREGAESHATVLRGIHASRMHEISLDDPFQPGDGILIDLGCYRRGYRAEFARSAQITGSMPGEFRNMLTLVSQAVQEAAECLRPGNTVGEVERRATARIAKGGYGEYAHPHPVGHGLGVTGLEHPLIVESSNYELHPSMVMNIEPGIFIPEDGVGIRIEDIFLVQDGPAECLTSSIPHII